MFHYYYGYLESILGQDDFYALKESMTYFTNSEMIPKKCELPFIKIYKEKMIYNIPDAIFAVKAILINNLISKA